jgi:hypothetical protein
MATRCSALTSLGLTLLFSTGCPEPDDEAGDDGSTTADTGESGDTSMDDPTTGGDGDGGSGSGVEDGGDVRAPLDSGGDDEGDGDGDGDAGDGDGDGPIDHPDRCWDRTWNGDTLPAVLFDNTIGRIDDFTGSCGIGPAPDFQLGFMAPWTGSFTFDTEGSSFDTVLFIHSGDCGEIELGCNDDFIGLDSKLTVELQQFQIVTVTVDGTGPFEEGPLVLSIYEADPPTCETEQIIPALPAQIIGDTTGGLSELASDCGGVDTAERLYEFVAPGPGSYRFNTAGSSFDTVLSVFDTCGGPPLACNDDAGFELHSELIVDLDGGDKLLVAVDGHDPADFGPFVLSVEEI